MIGYIEYHEFKAAPIDERRLCSMAYLHGLLKSVSPEPTN